MSSYTIISLEFADKFRALVEDQAEWSQATFGTDAERGPIGTLKHLALEAVEAQNAPYVHEEYADCMAGNLAIVFIVFDDGREPRYLLAENPE